MNSITRQNALLRTEYSLALVLTAASILLHIQLFQNIGEPWRDEVSTLFVATRTSFGEIWSMMYIDTFPILYYLLLHSWIGIFGDTTTAIRSIGLSLGIAGLLAVWWLGRVLRFRTPILTIALFGISASAIRYGDSVRAYGVGISFAVLMFGAFWKLLENFSARNVTFAAVASLAVVNTTYWGSVLLAAIGASAFLAAVASRRWRQALAIAIICVASAFSLLPYLNSLSFMRDLSFLIQHDIGILEVLSGFRRAASSGYSGNVIEWIWLALFAAALCAASWHTGMALSRTVSDADANLHHPCFLLFILILVPIAWALFLILNKYAVRPWYLITPMLIFVVTAEASYALFKSNAYLRVARITLGAIIFFAAIGSAPAELAKRATGMRDITAALEKHANPNDLIVLTDWPTGLTFNRLYKGVAPWMTIPDLGHHSVHHFDYLKNRMQDPRGIQTEIMRIKDHLASGKRIFIISGLVELPQANWRVPLPPAPHPYLGWSSGDYNYYWVAQVTHLIRETNSRIDVILPEAPLSSVMFWENPNLLLVSPR